jgi:hypothetical protein
MNISFSRMEVSYKGDEMDVNIVSPILQGKMSR